jgi:hypothetical protein
VAVGKWEFRAFCGISKRSGKPVFGFPRSGFSTAFFSGRVAHPFETSLEYSGGRPM